MPLKVAFIIPARNKVKDIKRAVDAALNQTFSPMEIVISDQGSEDGTLQIIKDLVSKYEGPNKVSILECPLIRYKGMAGLNSHLNWLNDTVDADIFICSSADDYSHPDRTKRVVEGFENTQADMVLTQQYFADENHTVNAITFHPKESKWITTKECIENLVGGSSSQAWSREFFKKAGPIPYLVSPDFYLATLASARKGLYFIAEPLHTYVKHNNPDNTGLEGKMRAVNGNDVERMKLTELSCYQIGTGYLEISKKFQEWKVPEETLYTVVDHMVSQCSLWISVRNSMDMLKVQPLNTPI